MNSLDRIESGYKAFKRAGDFIVKVFQKENKLLTGEECQKIKDWYGIPSHIVILLALSHGFDVDKENFARLLDEDAEKSKKMSQCNGNSTTSPTT